MSQFRLNQALAKTGLFSRRKADELIAAGRVKVNGNICRDFSMRINARKDVLFVDGQRIDIKEYMYVVLNKPKGFITTCSDERGRQSVLELLPDNLRHLRPVGRLDRDSEGLLLLSNDGEFTQKLTHPSKKMGKTYQVDVKPVVKPADLEALARGVMLDDGMTLPAKIGNVKKLPPADKRRYEVSRIQITIFEGRNRQVRRMFEMLGYSVTRLVRVAIGALQLGNMNSGSWRFLGEVELINLSSDCE